MHDTSRTSPIRGLTHSPISLSPLWLHPPPSFLPTSPPAPPALALPCSTYTARCAQPKTSLECFKIDQERQGIIGSPGDQTEKFNKLDETEKRKYALAAEADYREVPPSLRTRAMHPCCAPLRLTRMRSTLCTHDLFAGMCP